MSLSFLEIWQKPHWRLFFLDRGDFNLTLSLSGILILSGMNSKGGDKPLKDAKAKDGGCMMDISPVTQHSWLSAKSENESSRSCFFL